VPPVVNERGNAWTCWYCKTNTEPLRKIGYHKPSAVGNPADT
jgi:hypothetical protein